MPTKEEKPCIQKIQATDELKTYMCIRQDEPRSLIVNPNILRWSNNFQMIC